MLLVLLRPPRFCSVVSVPPNSANTTHFLSSSSVQAPLSARGRLETRLQIPVGFGANAGSLVDARGGKSFRIDAPSFALLEPSVRGVRRDGGWEEVGVVVVQEVEEEVVGEGVVVVVVVVV